MVNTEARSNVNWQVVVVTREVPAGSQDDSLHHATVRRESHRVVPSLTDADCVLVVESKLAKYNKRLHPSQMDLLISRAPENRSPSWFGTACEDLIRFGIFELVSERISQLPSDTVELWVAILARIERQQGEMLVGALCSALAVSVNGLTLSELCSIATSDQSKEWTTQPNSVQWADTVSEISFLLSRSDATSSGLCVFANSLVKEAAKTRYVGTKQLVDQTQSRLAAFLRANATWSRIAVEGLELAVKLNDQDLLKEWLTHPLLVGVMIDAEAKADRILDLVRYWTIVDGGSETARVLLELQFEKCERLRSNDEPFCDLTKDAAASFMLNICRIFEKMTLLEPAERLYARLSQSEMSLFDAETTESIQIGRIVNSPSVRASVDRVFTCLSNEAHILELNHSEPDRVAELLARAMSLLQTIRNSDHSKFRGFPHAIG